ncbi:MAG: S1C family serine protease, partial [Thermoproteota archaeon]|nr:S1C family serine protease [Thermoproteota archaeon]
MTTKKFKRKIISTYVFTLAFYLASIHGINDNSIESISAQQLEEQIHAIENIMYGTTTNTSAINATSLTPNELFSRVQASVVQVTTTNKDIAGPISSGLGSGFIYDKNGHIITNYHVVALASLAGRSPNNASSYTNNTDIIVTFHDGSAYSARLVGSDLFSDIAV